MAKFNLVTMRFTTLEMASSTRTSPHPLFIHRTFWMSMFGQPVSQWHFWLITLSHKSNILHYSNIDSEFDDLIVVASGWGRIDEIDGSLFATHLQAVNLTTLSNDECRDEIGSLITENKLCATAPGKDACGGDSGGMSQFEWAILEYRVLLIWLQVGALSSIGKARVENDKFIWQIYS